MSSLSVNRLDPRPRQKDSPGDAQSTIDRRYDTRERATDRYKTQLALLRNFFTCGKTLLCRYSAKRSSRLSPSLQRSLSYLPGQLMRISVMHEVALNVYFDVPGHTFRIVPSG